MTKQYENIIDQVLPIDTKQMSLITALIIMQAINAVIIRTKQHKPELYMCVNVDCLSHSC